MDDLWYDVEVLPAAEAAGHLLPDDLGETDPTAASIEDAIWRATGGRVKNLRVEIGPEAVRLTGHCTTFYAKQQAQHAAMQAVDGDRVTNQIEVRLSRD